jgi:Zn-dependent protease with chaperone function
MKALTLEQFAAVLAHELGHVVCGHGRTASPQHRIRRLWARIEATFQQTAASDAACLPLARRNEYEADAMAARLTSPRGAAQALTSVTLIGCYLEHRYWPAVYAAAREAAAGDPAAGESAQCELAPISGFHLQAISAVPAEQLRQWQDSALKRRAGVRDTHPSLGDRLEALGESAEFAPPGPGKSADRLLGDALLRIEQALDLRWRKRVAKGRFSSRRSPF